MGLYISCVTHTDTPRTPASPRSRERWYDVYHGKCGVRAPWVGPPSAGGFRPTHVAVAMPFKRHLTPPKTPHHGFGSSCPSTRLSTPGHSSARNSSRAMTPIAQKWALGYLPSTDGTLPKLTPTAAQREEVTDTESVGSKAWHYSRPMSREGSYNHSSGGTSTNNENDYTNNMQRTLPATRKVRGMKRQRERQRDAKGDRKKPTYRYIYIDRQIYRDRQEQRPRHTRGDGEAGVNTCLCECVMCPCVQTPSGMKKKHKMQTSDTAPQFQIVEQQYTVLEQRPSVREKEVWVKQTVPEDYIEDVPVVKTRRIRVPVVDGELREEDGVELPEPDRDEDRIEVLEMSGDEDVGERDENLEDTDPVIVYPADHETVRDLDEVSPEDMIAIHTRYELVTPRGSRETTTPGGRRLVVTPGGTKRYSVTQRASGTTTPYYGSQVDGNYHLVKPASIGLHVRNAERQSGVAVAKVVPDQPGWEAGFRTHDLVTHVNNKPTRNLEQFRAVVHNSFGPLLVHVNRRCVGRVVLNVPRGQRPDSSHSSEYAF